MTDTPFSPTSLAIIKWLPRIGAADFQIRYDDDQDPVVWVAVAVLQPNVFGPGVFECAAGRHPDMAVLRLAETLVDGGRCNHCGRPTGFEPNWELVMDDGVLPICWATYDPERDEIRPGCGRDGSRA